MATRAERWVEIEDFPDYLVSNWGRVINSMTDRIKEPSVNQQGIPHVLLVRKNKQHRRGLALLVAEAFLDAPEREQFDTVINLNGDRLDCRAKNLMWRPRWFAIRYHQQMRRGPSMPNVPVYNSVTEDVYPNAFEAAKTEGLLEDDVFSSLSNNTLPFPTYHRYYFAEESQAMIEGVE